MNDREIGRLPSTLEAIRVDTERIGFALSSEPRTGALLRAFAASKPGGRVLELGTGTGMGTAWLLDGMDSAARLISVDSDPRLQNVAKRHLAGDPRMTFHLGDGGAFLEQLGQMRFDLIYADAWPGKFTHLDLTLAALNIGGVYFIDDLRPQPNWPEGHAAKVASLIASLESRPGFVATKLEWASGLLLIVRTTMAETNEKTAA